MSLYRPSELQAFLQTLGYAPSKGLSQNFLIDGNIIAKMIQSAAIQPGDVVLEIGSGPGVLTEALLNAGAIVMAVEKDQVLANALARLQTADNRLHVYNEDILHFDLTHLSDKLAPNQKAKVAANLPYHITTPILMQLVPHFTLFETLTVMVQKEVAERFCGVATGKEVGAYAAFYLRAYSTLRYAFGVSRRCFYPQPNVDSAVMSLTLQPLEGVDNPGPFFLFAKLAFEQRRKTVRSSLGKYYGSERVATTLKESGIDPHARPDALSFRDFKQLFLRLGPVPEDKQ